MNTVTGIQRKKQVKCNTFTNGQHGFTGGQRGKVDTQGTISNGGQDIKDKQKTTTVCNGQQM